jgi:type III secretion protein C
VDTLDRYSRTSALCLLLACSLCFTSWAGEPKWKKDPYSHNAQDESLRDMLSDFASTYGFRGVVSNKIGDRVSGRFEGQDPRRFLDKISGAYNLVWYYDGYAMYFYKSFETRTRVMTLQFITYPKLAANIKELGIWDDRFPLRSGTSGEHVYVTGPPRYVELVIETANRMDGKEMENAPSFSDGQIVQLFPLKYAWAGDVDFSNAGQKATIPGIASILNSLVNKDPLPVRPPWLDMEASTALRGLSTRTDDSPNGAAPVLAAQGLVKNRVAIFPDARTNSVVIKETKENLLRYRTLVTALDMPMGLVELSATIIDVSKGSALDLGVEWQVGGKLKVAGVGMDAKQGQTFSNLEGERLPNGDLPPPAPPALLDGYTFSTLVKRAGGSLLARLRLLEKAGKARIDARPTVLTFDNLQAHIAFTKTFHVRVAGERDANLFQVVSGTTLRVTPHIVESEGEKSVRLVVEIEDGSPSAESSVDNIPSVSTSVIGTQAVVGDEESLLLGGFIRTEEQVTSYQVPLLGSIPVLGYLFKKNTRVKDKIERIFMITPRIIQSAGEAGKIFEEDDRERRYQRTLVPAERDNLVPLEGEEQQPWGPR